jgi:hypothetical protein
VVIEKFALLKIKKSYEIAMQKLRVSTYENNMAVHFVAANAVHMTFKKQLSEALS